MWEEHSTLGQYDKKNPTGYLRVKFVSKLFMLL